MAVDTLRGSRLRASCSQAWASDVSGGDLGLRAQFGLWGFQVEDL